jgi:hypothetical protein
MSNFEEATIALLTELTDRVESLEQRHQAFYLALVLALKTAGIDLVKSMSYIESRRPTLDIPSAAAAPVLTTNQPSPSNAVPSGQIPSIVGVHGAAGDGG